MKVKLCDEVKLKVTMSNGQIIIDSGPLDIVCDNFEAGCPVNLDTDDAALFIKDSIDEGTPGSKVEFVFDKDEWKQLCMRADNPEDNVYLRK